MPDRLHFTGDDEADALLAQEPMALLIGFALDQQVPVPTAFMGPLKLKQRIGTLDAGRIAATDPADLRLHFHHVRGVTRGMVVTWHIRPAGPAGHEANVRIVHEFRRPLPLLGPDVLPRIVDRVFTRPIAGRTLAEFKRLAESQHPVGVAATNHTT